jgi:hypothetical protein
MPTPTLPEEKTSAVISASRADDGYEKDGFRFPPGLKLNLPFYILRRFFKASNPIALFEYLSSTYGPISHYKLGWQHIVFLNDPEMIKEILVNQPQIFIKERTQRRMKILLGEGLTTCASDASPRRHSIASASRPTPM